MKLLIIFLLAFTFVNAQEITRSTTKGEKVTIDASGFATNLNGYHDNVQKVASAVDSLSTGGVTILTAYKTADETVNNSSTYQDDDHLSLTVENATYIIELRLVGSQASGTPNAKFQINLPASGSLYGGGLMTQSSATTNTAFSVANTGDPVSVRTDWGYAGAQILIFQGYLTTGGAGTLTLQWAQNIADFSDTKVLKGSYLKLIKQ